MDFIDIITQLIEFASAIQWVTQLFRYQNHILTGIHDDANEGQLFISTALS